MGLTPYSSRPQSSREHGMSSFACTSTKKNENALEDLKADMRQYRQRYPNVQFVALDVSQAEYKTYTKLFAFPNDFYDYVAYLNPGPGTTFTLSVAMAKEKVPATQEELRAYLNVVRSLHVF